MKRLFGVSTDQAVIAAAITSPITINDSNRLDIFTP